MYKTVLLAIGLLLCFNTFAQWEKVMGKGGFPSHNGVSFSKYNTILTSNGTDKLYYSKDDGKNWRTLLPSFFKPTDTLTYIASIVNEQGIFALVSKAYPFDQSVNTDSTFIVSTPDFGKTWEKVFLPVYRIDKWYVSPPYYMAQNSKYIYVFAKGYAVPTPWINPEKFVVWRYNKSNKVWEDKTANYTSYPRYVLLTESAEYLGEYYNLKIKKFDGQEFYIDLNNTGSYTYQILTDSLLYRIYSSQSGVRDVLFSNNFGQSWYSIGSSFPLPKGDGESPNLHFYKNKMYGISNGRVYSSDDIGLNWSLESEQIFKYTGSIGLKPYFKDSIAFFSLCSSFHFGYNLTTKEITYYFTEHATNEEIFDANNKIDVLPNGYFILKTCIPQLHLVSKDKGANWSPNFEYPYYFDKIPVNDSTFYAKSQVTGFFQTPETERFVNNIKKDTVNFVPNFNTFVRKGDTVVLFTPHLGQKLYYSTQKPYDKWTAVPNSAFLAATHPIMYDNKQIITYNFLRFGEGNLLKVDLDGTYKEIPWPLGYSLLNFSQPTDLWFGNSNRGLLNTKDFGQTKTFIKLPQPYPYSVPSSYHANMAVIVKRNNMPNTKAMVVTALNTPHLTVDSGKFWIPFNIGLENKNTIALLQADSFLFAFTNDGGMYRRSVADISLRSVLGTVYIDENNNNVKDANEKPVVAKIISKRTGAFTLSDSSGFYNLVYDIVGTDSISIEFDNKYSTAAPSYYAISQSDTGKHFAIHFTPNIQDLKVSLTALTPPRPGFNNNYILTYKNVGSVTKDGTVKFIFEDKQILTTSTPPASSSSGQALIWNFSNLKPDESKTINLTFKTNTDVVIGSRITDIVSIEPIQSDNFKTDNVDTLIQTVVSSYDPNDKQVSFLNSMETPSVISENTELIYTIRFQNTGNYPAEFVRIEDSISDKLNLHSLRIIASSHPYKVSVKGERVLVFDFNPINLPDSFYNEALSHGFIKFAIRPTKVVPKGDGIKNTAYIYFDYNPSVTTNTVETKSIISKTDFLPSFDNLYISPNPARSYIYFSVKDELVNEKTEVKIYGSNGALRTVLPLQIEKDNLINIANLNDGLYIIHLKIKGLYYIGKFMISR